MEKVHELREKMYAVYKKQNGENKEFDLLVPKVGDTSNSGV